MRDFDVPVDEITKALGIEPSKHFKKEI